MARNYPDWIKGYMEFTEDSESPTSFSFWTAVWVVAGALQRRVWIDMRKFQWTPNFYIIFVGPPGIVAKSTCAAVGWSFLSHLPNNHFGPESLTWQGLGKSFEEAFYYAKYLDANGTKYRITNGLIDSGGTRRGYQKHSRTVEVYEWCSRHRQMMPLKGMHGRQGDTVTYKEIETYPGTNKKVPGGLKRANLRVDLFKDELERRLQIQPDDHGALSFHCDIDEAFAKHYTAEVKDEQGEWTHNRKNRNDYWDCTVYLIALYEMIKLRIPKRPVKTEDSGQRTVASKNSFVTGWKK